MTLAPSLLAAAVAFAQVDAETKHTLGIALQLTPQPPPAKPKPEPDSLILNNGAQIFGELESATAAAVTFRDQSLGELTIAWSKIKEIHSSHIFAVIPKGVKVTNKEEAKAIPEGTVSVADKNIQVAQTGAGPLVEPVANTAHVVARDDFDEAFESPGVFGNWSGSVNAGASLITATQNVTNLTGGLNLSRNVPGVDWRDLSNRTLIDYDMS